MELIQQLQQDQVCRRHLQCLFTCCSPTKDNNQCQNQNYPLYVVKLSRVQTLFVRYNVPSGELVVSSKSIEDKYIPLDWIVSDLYIINIPYSE